MALYINAVAVPDIPSDVLEQYPYAWIRKNTTSDYYDLLLAKSAWTRNEENESLDTSSYTEGIQWYRTSIDAPSTTEWTFNQVWNTGANFGEQSTRACVWANHDVLNADGTVYFAESPDLVLRGEASDSSTPEVDGGARYSALGSWFTDVADEIRRLTGKTDTMTIDTMLSELKSLS